MAFCAWCEATDFANRPEKQAATWLARLHASALELPDVEPENDDDPPKVPATSLALAEQNLGHFSGMYYRVVFDPRPELTEEPVMGDIGDDLLDTYKDIKVGLILHERSQNQEALWYWSFLHRVHWGKHAVDALAALHNIASEGST